MTKKIYFEHPTQGKTSLNEIKADIEAIKAKNNSASMDKLAFSCNTVAGLVAKIEELDALAHPQNSEKSVLSENMALLGTTVCLLLIMLGLGIYAGTTILPLI